jgi:phosphate transport system permease protein
MVSQRLSNRNDVVRQVKGSIVYVLCTVAVVVSLVSLAVLLFDAIQDGLPWLDLQFITSFPSRFPEQSGILPALWGSIWDVG